MLVQHFRVFLALRVRSILRFILCDLLSSDVVLSHELPVMVLIISAPFGAVVRFSYPSSVTRMQSSMRQPQTR